MRIVCIGVAPYEANRAFFWGIKEQESDALFFPINRQTGGSCCKTVSRSF